MFTWIGTRLEQLSSAIIDNFLLGVNLEGVKHISDDDVKDACTIYAKRSDVPFPHILTPIHKQL